MRPRIRFHDWPVRQFWLTENDIEAIEREYAIQLAPETGTARAITGHIDFLQVRNDAVHILDYKPDAHTNKPIAQLTIYALALARLTGIRLFDIKCAWFNENEYCEFFPHTLLSRSRTQRATSRTCTMGTVVCISIPPDADL